MRTAKRTTAVLGLICGAALCAPGIARASYISTLTSQSPLFYWQFNETARGPMSAAIVNDTSHTNNANTQTTILVNQSSGALTPANGYGGFSSSNTYFTFPGTASSDFVTSLTSTLAAQSDTLGSVSSWVKTTTGTFATSPTFGTLYRIDAGATGDLYTFMDPSGHFGLRITNGNGEPTVLADIRTTGVYNDGSWHHVAATWDAATNTAMLYVDGGAAVTGGVTVGSAGDFATGTTFTSTGRHQFGKGTNNASLFQGSADELAIWNTELTAAQVQAQYLSALPEPACGALLCGGGMLLTRRRART